MNEEKKQRAEMLTYRIHWVSEVINSPGSTIWFEECPPETRIRFVGRPEMSSSDIEVSSLEESSATREPISCPSSADGGKIVNPMAFKTFDAASHLIEWDELKRQAKVG